jgi:hypothetical protein
MLAAATLVTGCTALIPQPAAPPRPVPPSDGQLSPPQWQLPPTEQPPVWYPDPVQPPAGDERQLNGPAPQTPERQLNGEETILWWDIVREPLAPDLGSAVAVVLAELPLYDRPAIDVNVLTDGSVPERIVADTEALLGTLVRLVPESRMNGVEILIGSDPEWLAARIAASSRILDVERENFLARLADGSTGAAFNYSLRGPNHEQTIVTLAAPGDLVGTVLAEGLARELSPNLFSVYATGTPDDRWPCWAAEGLGYPLAWEATARTFGGSYRQYRDFWVSQLRDRPERTLGLAASESFQGTNTNPCLTGAGHLQGALAGELIVADHGVDGLFAWAKASGGRSWRDGYADTFSETVEVFYDRFDRDAVGELR